MKEVGGSLNIELLWPPAKLSPNGSHGWTADEVAMVRAAYAGVEFGGQLRLGELARRLGRNKANVCRKARGLGLTDLRRRKVEKRKDRRKFKGDEAALSAARSACAKAMIAENGHPRGMLGKKHTPETCQLVREKYSQWWESMSEDDRAEHTAKALKSKFEKYGTLAMATGEGRSWKAGWREIADKRHYFRSRWEANYARYLQWLKERGDILEWEYEPETFWFEGIKRGVRSYLPDFRVHELNGSKPIHEVKGWMDARSKTTLKRMAKYHPQETIILIREKDYKALSRFSALIGGWE